VASPVALPDAGSTPAASTKITESGTDLFDPIGQIGRLTTSG